MDSSDAVRGAGHGGTANDADLSASQLRARYAVQNNTFQGGGDSSLPMMIGAIVVVAIIGAIVFFMQQQ